MSEDILKIGRPRQLYVGNKKKSEVIPINDRKDSGRFFIQKNQSAVIKP